MKNKISKVFVIRAIVVVILLVVLVLILKQNRDLKVVVEERFNTPQKVEENFGSRFYYVGNDIRTISITAKHDATIHVMMDDNVDEIQVFTQTASEDDRIICNSSEDNLVIFQTSKEDDLIGGSFVEVRIPSKISELVYFYLNSHGGVVSIDTSLVIEDCDIYMYDGTLYTGNMCAERVGLSFFDSKGEIIRIDAPKVKISAYNSIVDVGECETDVDITNVESEININNIE